jgi:hypothetical protein
MEILDAVGQVEARLCTFGDSVNLDARKVHGLFQMCIRLRNNFGHTRWNSKVTWIKWKLISVSLDIVLILAQDRCTVSIECTIGSKIILVAPDGTPR